MTDHTASGHVPAQESPGLEERVLQQHAAAFRAEELEGLRVASRAILISIGIIAVWLVIQVGMPRVYYYEAILAGFAAIFYANYRLGHSRFARPWHPYLFTALGIALLVFTLVYPNPFVENWPTQMRLRFGNFVYVLAFLAPIALGFSPKLMLWAGAVSALFWGIGVGWVLSLPDTVTYLSAPPEAAPPTADQALTTYLDPHFVDIEARVQDMIVVLLVAGVLAAVAWRSRRLVIGQIAVARERANLARFFPPKVVDELAGLDKPLDVVRSQPVAVMFIDIVGFTRFAERHEPGEIIATLREYHARLEREIFEHGGSLDKFLGDGVMATFGTPYTGPRDAENALACARAILRTMADWNAARRQRWQAELSCSIGIHYGEVVLGDIGSARRLEFTVLGDVVNVANRLEELTRDLGCEVVVSDTLVRSVRDQAPAAAETLLDGFSEGEARALKGRSQQVKVWTLAGGRA